MRLVMVITGLTQRAPPEAEDPNGFTSPRGDWRARGS
jgi:hypothetical protein